jgi:hypothetical protein
MDGDEDSDAIVVNGSTSANDVVLVSANGARLNFTRTSPGPFGLDIGTAESLVVNGIGGNDSLTLNDLTGVASVTSVFLHGFDGDDSFSVVQPSAGSLQFSVNGHGGTDSLQGPNAASAWTLPAVDPGTITGLIGFRSIETLLGGTGADTFDLHGRASLLTVNGGTANDTLLYHAESRAVTGDTTPPDGVINSPGVQPIAFSQIEAVTILDPQPTMTIDDVTRGEGSSLPNATFTVTLSNASLLTVTVNYATADGTAAAPGDYASQSGVLTFAPGATTQTIAVPINVDTLVEGSETFFVNLSGAVNAGLADAQGQGTITDNAVPTITAIPNQTLAFGAATGALPFTVGDVETAAAFLIVTATSSNPTLVPVGNIGFGGGVANRTVTVTPAAAQVGTSAITLTVTDIGGASASTTFNVTVNQPTTVQPPTNLYVSAMAGNQVTFRFTPAPIGPPATGFALEGGLTAGQVLASLPTGSDAPIFSYPVPSGSFYVRIVATRGAERSAPSNEIRIHVNVPVAPSAPDLFTSAVNGNNLLLSWRNTFGGGAATGLMLDVSGAYTLQVPLGLAETFAVSGVPPGSYSLRLQALNAGGSSPATSPVTFAIPSPCQGSPQLPTNVLFYRIGNNAYLVWEPPSSGPAADRYTINVTGSFTATFQTTARSASGQVGPGSYTITLAAVNACGTSAPTLPQTLVVP